MKKISKFIINRTLACLLIVCLTFTLIPTIALAEGTETGNETTEISLSVDVYDQNPENTGAQFITPLVAEGSTQKANLGSWEYTETRFLNIQADNIPMDKQYELVVEMQPIIKAMGNPENFVVAGVKPTFTSNTMVVNKTGVFTAEDYSGTIVWALSAGTEKVGFSLELGYDITLWSKLAGELNNDINTPLVTVYLREVTTDTIAAKMNLHCAQAPATWSENLRAWSNGLAEHIWSREETSNVVISRMVNGNYAEGFYYPKLEIKISIPKYTDENGNVYYLKPELGSLKAAVPSKIGTADLNSIIDDTNHEIIITLTNYYTTANTHLSNINFTLPTEVADAIAGEEVRVFKGKVTMTQFRSADALVGENISVYNSGAFDVKYLTQDNSLVSSVSTSAKTYVGYPDAVNFLGVFALQNLGTSASKPYRVKLLFDTEDKKAVQITTVNIMPDYVSENIEIKYEMINSDGESKLGTYSLKNTNCGKTPTEKKYPYLTLERSMINGSDDSDYYFKSIEYTIESIPAGIRMYHYQSTKDTDSAGTFWGHVVGKSGETVKVKVDVYEEESDGVWKDRNDLEPKNGVITITLDNTYKNSYYLENVKITKDNTAVTEIQAGEDFNISGQVSVTEYPYSQTGILRNVRIGIMLPQGITITKEDVSTRHDVEIVVNQPTEKQPLWIIEFNNNDLLFGYYDEDLTYISNGKGLAFSITLHTEREMPETTLQLVNILWAAGKDQMNQLSGNYGKYLAKDEYNLNGTGGTNDNVTKYIKKKATDHNQITINDAPAFLDIESTVHGSMEDTDGTSAALEHFADYVTYDLKIACTDGGSSEEFFYLIPIPKTAFDDETEFVSLGEVNLNLADKPKVSNSSGTGFELYYSTENFTTYNMAASANDAAWESIDNADADFDWNSVTMLKVLPKEESIKTGTLGVVSVQLEYDGSNYQYQADAEKAYAQNAGKVVQFCSRGYYNHSKGVQAFAGTTSSEATTIRLEYTIPETQYIELTAVKDKTPGENRYITAEVEIDTLFDKEQTYSVLKVDPSNVNLVPSGSNFSTMNCNTNFGIQVKLDNGTPIDLDASASVTNPLPLGTVASKEKAKFIFEIFNGNALSDTITERTVQLDIIGHNGVTIPVVITIKVIATPVDDASIAIVGQQEYTPFTGSTSTSISENSAFTAQFVIDGLVPNSYPTRTLSFSCEQSDGSIIPKAPLEGTTILMIDYADRSAPRYYYYKLDGNTSAIDLTSFVNLADGNPYVNPTGNAFIEETFLFVVDFPIGTESSNQISLTWKATEGSDLFDVANTLDYTVSDSRTFALAVPVNSEDEEELYELEIGKPITISYENEAPESADNYYSTRDMALVITPASGSVLPTDAKLAIGTGIYTQNANKQFIVPLGALASSGKVKEDKSVTLLSEGVVANCTMDVELWVSATSNESAPFAGQQVAKESFIVTPHVLPSFKVIDMSQRKFVIGEDELQAQISYLRKQIDGYEVQLQVQKKIDSGYAADDYYLSMINSVQASTKVVDITNLIFSNKDLDLDFSDKVTTGTYRLLFTVVQGEEVVLTVPYNFMVLPE